MNNLCEPWSLVHALSSGLSLPIEQGHIALRYGQWTLAVKLFRIVEKLQMYRQRPTSSDIASHKMCLTQLLAYGETIRLIMEQTNAKKLANMGVLPNTVDIITTTLENSFCEWHSLISKERINELQPAVSDAPPFKVESGAENRAGA